MRNSSVGHALEKSGDDSVAQDVTNTLTIGDQLKLRREALGISLDKIAQDLCLGKATVRAIETGDSKALPEKAFVAGFVRTLADYLGMDGAAAAQSFKAAHSDHGPAAIDATYVDAIAQARTPSLGWVSGVFGVMGLVATWVWIGSVGADDAAALNSATVGDIDAAILREVQSREPIETEMLPASYTSLNTDMAANN